MGDGHLTLLDEGARGGASHAGFAGPLNGTLDDGGIGRLDGGAEQDVIGVLGHVRRDGLDGDGACDLTRRVPSHAVADGEEGGLDEEGVLVVLA